MREQRLLWVDLETTGLDPMRCLLLEAGLLLTDDRGRELAAVSFVIGYPDVRARVREQVVRDMHERSGLLDEVERSRLRLDQAEEALLGWVDKREARGLLMAGSGVGSFDRPWLREHMPRLAEVWHHRTFDMTTVRTLFELEKPDHAHRALADLRADAEMLRTVRARLDGVAARSSGLAKIGAV